VKLSATRLFPLLLTLALALLSFWLERTLRVEDRHPALRRHDPDVSVEVFRIDRYNASGAREATVEAAKMVHYPDDDSTELFAPRIEQTRAGHPRLTLSAERGALSQNGDEVFLYGDVLLLREGDARHPATQVRTSFLHLVTERSIARTHRDVTVTEAGRSLSARGLEYHHETRQLYLRERVRGRFEARRAPRTPS